MGLTHDHSSTFAANHCNLGLDAPIVDPPEPCKTGWVWGVPHPTVMYFLWRFVAHGSIISYDIEWGVQPLLTQPYANEARHGGCRT